MAKLALVLFVTLIFSFEFLDTVKSEEEEEHAAPAEEGEDRAGFAHAAATAQAAQQGLYRPGPGLIRPRPLGPLSPVPSSGSVQCYTCIDCTNAEPGQLKQCSSGIDPSKSKKCVTYTEKYKHQKEAVIRGCASERGSCAEIKKALSNIDVKLLHCHECEGDRCNSATRSFTDLTMAFLALLVTPLVAKVTLS